MRNSGILGCFLACLVAPLAAEEYTVQRGDTLSTIADRELGRSSAWRELCELNDLTNCDRITVGMTLRLNVAADQPGEVDAEHVSTAGEEISDSATASGQSRETGMATEQDDERPDAIFVEVYSLDSPLGLPFNIQDQYNISRTDKGVELSGYVSDPVSTGRTDGAYIRVSDFFEHAASGNRIRIEITASSTEGSSFAAAYSTADVGNSRWQELAVGSHLTVAAFEFEVPQMQRGNGDYLGILPDPDDTGQVLTISEIRFVVLTE